MDLALATGIGPSQLADLERRQPVFSPDDVVAVAFRDEWTHPPPQGIQLLPLKGLDRARLDQVGLRTADGFASRKINGFWLHVDVDVIDSTLMPAVDSPQPDGLTYGELARLLHPLLASPSAVGVQVTIFDPELDGTGELVALLVETLANAFSGKTFG
jgi:arginase